MAKPGPEQKVDSDEILLRFVLSTDAAFIASEFTEFYDVERQTVRNWFDRLEEEGYLRSKKATNRVMFTITEKGRKRVEEVFLEDVMRYVSGSHQP